MIRLASLAFAALGWLVGWGPSQAAGLDPDTHLFSQTLGDFRDELALAREEGKSGILIFFEMDECPWCHRMETTVLNQPGVQAFYREHFAVFQVDVEGDVEIVDFEGNTTTMKEWATKVHRVRATPVFAFFDLDGKRVTRHIGVTKDAEEFLMLGEYVVKGLYKDMSFVRYKRGPRETPERK
jgi:thioredoxin-related protein